jgi:hypothetical protein
MILGFPETREGGVQGELSTANAHRRDRPVSRTPILFKTQLPSITKVKAYDFDPLHET